MPGLWVMGKCHTAVFPNVPFTTICTLSNNVVALHVDFFVENRALLPAIHHLIRSNPIFMDKLAG